MPMKERGGDILLQNMNLLPREGPQPEGNGSLI